MLITASEFVQGDTSGKIASVQDCELLFITDSDDVIIDVFVKEDKILRRIESVVKDTEDESLMFCYKNNGDIINLVKIPRTSPAFMSWAFMLNQLRMMGRIEVLVV